MFCLVALCALMGSAFGGFPVHHAVPYVYLSNPIPAAVSYATPIVQVKTPFVGQSRYHSQNTLGQYSYGFTSTDGISKSESRNVDGSVTGGYGYTSPEGQKIHVSYTAGEEGFTATGDAIPKPVEATAEVKEATLKHMTAKAEAETKAIKTTEEKKTVFIASPTVPLTYTYPYTFYHSYPSVSYSHSYKFPVVSYKTIVPVTEVKPVPLKSHSYAFTS